MPIQNLTCKTIHKLMNNKPNIILINCDDLGYGDVGCYGSTLNHTPRLDRMAAEGTRFTDFLMPAPVCTPSRAGMMTGCYPKRIGLETGFGHGVLFPGDPIGLHPDEITVATLLRKAGYATGLVGKWHIGDQPPFMPTSHGFDSYFGLPYSNDHSMSRTREQRGGLPERFREHGLPPLPLLQGTEVIETEPDQSRLTARYTEEAVDFIREHKEGPFFLYLAHLYVHLPYFPPAEFLARSKNGDYGAEVECIDWSTGVILDTLTELGIAENTLVLFTSDNGGDMRFGSNAPLRGSKGQLWEGGFRDPLIAWWPGTIPAGRTCSTFCTAMDFLPTFAALSGQSAPTDRVIDGHDISPVLLGHSDVSPYEAFYYYAGRGKNLGVGLGAVRRGTWKLHLQSGELYDLANDIGETTDVAADHPEVVRDLQSLADTCRADLGDNSNEPPGPGCRPVGRVDNPRLLAWREGLHPHFDAMYD